MKPIQLPTKIDDVILRLDEIITHAKKIKSRTGYFASMYKRVTIEIKNKTEAGFFDNNERMRKLVVVFANRYLEAYYLFHENGNCTSSWKVAFEATKKRTPLVLQHLILALNAHIGLDLCVAAATICPGEEIIDLKNDFEKINTVLDSLVTIMRSELEKIWPVLKPVDFVGGKLEEKLTDFSIQKARDAAWKNALRFANTKKEEELQILLVERDKHVSKFGKELHNPGLLFNWFLLLLRLFEIGDIKKKIAALNRN